MRPVSSSPTRLANVCLFFSLVYVGLTMVLHFGSSPWTRSAREVQSVVIVMTITPLVSKGFPARPSSCDPSHFP